MNIEVNTTKQNQTIENVSFTHEERCALDKALQMAARKFYDAGKSFTSTLQERTSWSLIGAMRTSGINGMFDYVKTATIAD